MVAKNVNLVEGTAEARSWHSRESACDLLVNPADWFCVFAKPRQENFARLHLDRQGMETFLPMLRTRASRGRNGRWLNSPLFPRYVFVRPGSLDSFSRLRSTLGVASLVSFGGRPALVPPEVVISIRERCENEWITLEESEFRKGDRVTILAGPYQGMNAIFDAETSREDRVIILLEIMASVAKVSIERQFLVSEAANTCQK